MQNLKFLLKGWNYSVDYLHWLYSSKQKLLFKMLSSETLLRYGARAHQGCVEGQGPAEDSPGTIQGTVSQS